MSPANVDLVAEWMRAVNDGAIDASMALAHPEVEMIEAPSLPGAHSLRGHEALERYWRGWQRNWSEWEWRAQEVIDVPPDRVVVVARLALRGLRSGVDVDRVWAYVFTVRDGLLIRQEGYDDRAGALEAVGLPK